MKTTQMSPAKIVHRLLFHALMEIRFEGNEEKNPLVFHLADLFHNVVPAMERAAEGRWAFEEVLKFLEAQAKEKGLEKWLSQNLADLDF